ncbi:hypothetical protein [Streptomyces smyrnaeus]|uniref:hypothetical protein n=1 Tax=Streptomyces smyrnaeus TaxID=1387713 RepID=UPI0036C04A39
MHHFLAGHCERESAKSCPELPGQLDQETAGPARGGMDHHALTGSDTHDRPKQMPRRQPL